MWDGEEEGFDMGGEREEKERKKKKKNGREKGLAQTSFYITILSLSTKRKVEILSIYLVRSDSFRLIFV